MIDPLDTQTPDIFKAKRGRGRPKTATPEKRRADNAERQRRFREKQRVKAILVDMLTQAVSPDATYEQKASIHVLPHLLAFASGTGSEGRCSVEYIIPETGTCSGSTYTFAETLDLIAQGVQITELS